MARIRDDARAIFAKAIYEPLDLTESDRGSVGRLANELHSIMDRAQQREARESVGQFSYSSSVFKKPTPDWSR